MPDARISDILFAGFEAQHRTLILERHSRGPDHIERGDLQYLTDDQLEALRLRAYGAWMKIAVCNTAANSGRYRLGLRWQDVFIMCGTEAERREAEGKAA